MAFNFLNSGSGQSKTASTQMQTGYQSALSAGTLVVFAIAKDNNATGADGDYSEVVSIVDDAGNTYTKLVEFTNTQAAAAGGATISIWYCVLSAGSGSLITMNFSASHTARAWCYDAFSMAAGSDAAKQSSATRADDAADTGALTISGLASKEYLFFRATAYEGVALSTTLTSLWTNGGGAGTTGGSGATNMQIMSEWKIATATTATSDPTLSGSSDNVSAMVAMYEIAGTPPATGSSRFGLLGVG